MDEAPQPRADHSPRSHAGKQYASNSAEMSPVKDISGGGGDGRCVEAASITEANGKQVKQPGLGGIPDR